MPRSISAPKVRRGRRWAQQSLRSALFLSLVHQPLLWLACRGTSDPQPDGLCVSGGPCRDSDCDTICDLHEGSPSRDSDGDGQPDYLDTDADNDGLSDQQEAGDQDPRTPPADLDGNGIADYLEGPLSNLPPSPTGSDGGLAKEDDPPLHDGAACTPTAATPCAASEHQGACDGLDNDCDGAVDEEAFCPCDPGTVRACFAGKPSQRNIGACRDGLQRCGGDEFPSWGPCSGTRLPSIERCDNLDNDCNGCVDDLADCSPRLLCPAADDPRIPQALPYHEYILHGSDFYRGGDALGFQWRIAGSPCDRHFTGAYPEIDPADNLLSYTMDGDDQEAVSLAFALSGEYPVELTVQTPNGPQTCAFSIPVRGPGLRVELCWDRTGPAAFRDRQAVDLDLHLGKYGLTTAWEDDRDCYFRTCRSESSPWSYPPSPLENCAGSQNDAVYSHPAVGHCPNPRLDADNRLDARGSARYVTENINLDHPATGDQLRVLVHYNTNLQSTDAQPHAIETRPMLNLYCGGALVASLGGELSAPETSPVLQLPGQRWRAADISITQGGPQAHCQVVIPRLATGEYDVDGGSDRAF